MEEIRVLFKSYGWSTDVYKRKTGKVYIYGIKKLYGKLEKFYLGPQVKVEKMSEEQIVEKLEAATAKFVAKKLEAKKRLLELELAETEGLIEERKTRIDQSETTK